MNRLTTHLACAIVAVYVVVCAGCIQISRSLPDTGQSVDTPTADSTGGDNAPDVPTQDGNIGPDVGVDTGPVDVGIDVATDAPPVCPGECPQPSTFCRSYECNLATGLCEPIDKPAGTPCSDTCAPASCSSGICVPEAVTFEPGVGCAADSDCPSSTPCIVQACKQTTCTCEIVGDGAGPNCCLQGDCQHLSGPPGCAQSQCDAATNECVAQPFDALMCACQTDGDCGPPGDPCKPWVCAGSCLQGVNLDCVACPDGTDTACIDAANSMGGCVTGVCNADFTCDFPGNPDCEQCTTAADCLGGTGCDITTCNVGACVYIVDPECALCGVPADCKVPADPCEYSTCIAGVCGTADLPSPCGPTPDCVVDGDCDDQNACTVNTCLGGTCFTTNVPICSSQECTSSGILLPSVVKAAPLGSLVKVAGNPSLNLITGQFAIPCNGFDGSHEEGPVAISNGFESISTIAGAIGNPQWACAEDCGVLSCQEPYPQLDYWVWGNTVPASDYPFVDQSEDPFILVAGWCLAMEVPNIEGWYDVTITLDNNFYSDQMLVETLFDVLTVQFQSGAITATNPTLDLALNFMANSTIPWMAGQVMVSLTGVGNTLQGFGSGTFGFATFTATRVAP